MASKPFMKLYISDYLIDTQYLTTEEHGAYLLLIMTYFQTGKSLPDDDKKLSQICKISQKKFKKIKSTVLSFFSKREGKLIHKRIEKELHEVREKSDSARVSAIKRWGKEEEKSDEKMYAFALQTQSERNANAMLSDTDTDTDTDTEKERSIMSGKPDVAPLQKNSEIKKQAMEVLDFLNAKTGKDFRKVDTNLNFIMARLKSGASVEDCKQVIVKKTREWKGDENMAQYLRPSTLFNATKFEQYVGNLVGD